MAWLLRNTAGEASLIISNGLASGTISPERLLYYMKYVGGIDIAMERAAVDRSPGCSCRPRSRPRLRPPRPPISRSNIVKLRDDLAKMLSSRAEAGHDGQPMEPDHRRTHGLGGESRGSSPRRGEGACASPTTSAAIGSLTLQLVLLAAAIVLTFGAMTMVSRRVIGPLHTIRDAMLKVAGGDLSVEHRLWSAP